MAVPTDSPQLQEDRNTDILTYIPVRAMLSTLGSPCDWVYKRRRSSNNNSSECITNGHSHAPRQRYFDLEPAPHVSPSVCACFCLLLLTTWGWSRDFHEGPTLTPQFFFTTCAIRAFFLVWCASNPNAANCGLFQGTSCAQQETSGFFLLMQS